MDTNSSFSAPSTDLITLLKQLDIIFRKPVTLSSGKISDFYVDVKRAYGDSRALNLIADELYKNISRETTCITAMGYGGISPASVIASRNNINLALVRDVPKKHGLGGLIDGYFPNKNDKVSIVDDVFTTGGSLRKIISVLAPTNAKILGCHVVVKRGDANFDSPLTYLLTVDDLIN